MAVTLYFTDFIFGYKRQFAVSVSLQDTDSYQKAVISLQLWGSEKSACRGLVSSGWLCVICILFRDGLDFVDLSLHFLKDSPIRSCPMESCDHHLGTPVPRWHHQTCREWTGRRCVEVTGMRNRESPPRDTTILCEMATNMWQSQVNWHLRREYSCTVHVSRAQFNLNNNDPQLFINIVTFGGLNDSLMY